MSKPPSDPPRRAPAAFSYEDEAADPRDNGRQGEQRRKPESFSENIVVTPDEDDPFVNPDKDLSAVPVATPLRRRTSFGKIAAGAFGILLSLAIGLWTDSLIRDLFTRADWLGYAALAVLAVGILAVLALVIRETSGMMRLAAVQQIKAEAEAAILETRPAKARAVVAQLTTLLSANPETSKGRATLKATEGEVIDPPHLIALAERELLAPLDRKARALIVNASKRVSIVTAVSPRAVVDLLYVLYEAVRLVRAMAELYGGRPGTLGMFRLLRDVLAHLAVTGSIAVGDSLVQQVLGHGLASKLSARLGEGVINGLMTARIGIAAMDLCRPLAFHALKRPGIGDFIGDLTPSMSPRGNNP
ncbi:YcjF family protein [Rhizobium leguminosarum]|uniref:YcjF family protein n=1 Tax=Rhizobium leguminosarum TaxID=384 RepID=UPI00102FCE3A|nr:TIGR01620 family protein [Rhizobium leguminosarum]TAU83961.1 TIGR01620 family protein [Rhizobium leguminosarum]TAX10094.1 TIGR01620 family protein [Rhizobium leguminosarum]TAY12857.1 TIGR01620 family protein [Rhizobium leguminosarum]TAZ14760.1 TIGR01620 family protein [Rhizobium leguminosarum]